MPPDDVPSTNQQPDRVAERPVDLAGIQSPFLEGLPGEQLATLLTHQERRSFAPGAHVLVQGERSQAIYRNLASILSGRLARSNQRLLHQRDHLIALPEKEAPPLLGYALACSLAWHTRHPILLLVLAEPSSAPEPLRQLAFSAAMHPTRSLLPTAASHTLPQQPLPPRTPAYSCA